MLPATQTVVSSLVYGLVTGSMYALMAVGFSLIYGIMRVINFAHGALYMLGAYVTFLLTSYLNLEPMLAVTASFLAVFGVGTMVERFLITPLRIRGEDFLLNSMLVTIGLSIFIENVMLEIFGAYPRGKIYYYIGQLSFFGVSLSVERLIFLIAGVTLILLFAIFIKYSKQGKIIRAAAMNPEAAVSSGIDLKKVYLLTFSIGSGLAAVAGGLLLPITFAHPFVGHEPSLIMFVVVVLGGLGSIAGALLSGFILGLTKSFVTLFFGAVIHDIIAFIVLLVILLVRPQGLMGWERPRV
ncbi:MAG: branched-chain amino acid ABC transporter permease [Candidatus Caldarchaeum sp.]|nr:branched-chain amino acid ABC transporter permease [Candidatus Caldarchaeum sp.]